jgi:hypothetical protein
MRTRLVPVLLLVLAACGGKGSSPPEVSSECRSPKTIRVRAACFVEDLAAGRFSRARSSFDATMKEEKSLAALENDWKTYQELVGAYESHGTPDEVKTGVLLVERVPVTTDKGKGEVRVTYHANGTIAGVFFLRAGVPGP